MNGRKAQIIGQVFTYIMAAIVIGGIALMGYYAISKITVRGCETEKISFKANIEDMIGRYNSDGSVNKQSIRSPCEYEVICFVDAGKTGQSPAPTGYSCNNTLINDSVKSGVQQNIFVISNKHTIPIGYSSLVSLNATYVSGCLCITQRNKYFNLVFRGRGSSTEISSS